MTLREHIQNLPLFKFATNEDIDFIESISSLNKYPTKGILYYESELSNKLLFLVDGTIKVYKVDKYDNEIFLYYIYQNNMISELSSLDNDSIYCSSNAEFIEDSIVLSINYNEFKHKYLICDNIISIFIQELINKNQQMQCIINRELVFDASSKVAHMIYNDLEIFNRQKRTEVSFMLHIQPETLSRVLKRMVRNEIIVITKGKVNILDEENLKSIFIGVQ